MKIAKVFWSGNSQAVRLPKEFQFHSTEVEIFKQGNNLILHERPQNIERVFELLTSLPDDFMSSGRNDTPPQDRDFE